MYPPRKPKNRDRREREYLLPDEIERMLAGCTKKRDALMISLMHRHGLRVSEVESLRWDDIALDDRKIRIRRTGGGLVCEHPLRQSDANEVREHRFYPRYLFFIYEPIRERNPELVFPIKARAIHSIVDNAARAAGLRFPVHPSMLRHSCGYHVADKLRDIEAVQRYLGLKTLQSAARYFVARDDGNTGIWDF